MRVRWLGNSCVEIFGGKQILIDPNPIVEPERRADLILVTHEHDDHFSRKFYEDFGKNADLVAPKFTLEKFDLNGKSVEPNDEVDGVKVLESNCWKSKESVSYFYRGVLHSGDSADFPDVDGKVKLIFSACFPDYYDTYLRGFKRLKPDLVFPFHYDESDGKEDALGLQKRLEEEDIDCKILEFGESIEI